MKERIEADPKVQVTDHRLRQVEGFPEMAGWSQRLVAIFGVIFAVLTIYAGSRGGFAPMVNRPFHLLFVGLIGLMIYSSGIFKKKSLGEGLFNSILIIIYATSMIWITLNWVRLYLDPYPTMTDLVLGVAAIVITLDIIRRTIGYAIVSIAVVAIIYCIMGPYLPYSISHRGFSLDAIVAYMYTGTAGIFGIPVGVCVFFIFLFIIFGSFLAESGAATYLMNMAYRLTGGAPGGPAKVAIVSSALMGTISGSAVANVTTTGAVTIPMMKQMGFLPEVAGAIEAVASTGGQLMPPVMGAAAFVVAEFTGRPYIEVCIAAAIPAVLYYISLYCMIHQRSLRRNIRGLPEGELPSLTKAILDSLHIFIPIIILVYLLVMRYTPTFAALYAIITLLGASWLRKATRMGWGRMIRAVDKAARSIIPVSAACAGAGVIVGTMTLTGVGLKITDLIVTLAGGSLFLGLILTMIVCLILGMGLPTTASYIITAALGAPALIKLGAPFMAAHLFILYFAIISNITPPVCFAAFAGAGIAGASPMKTGFMACRMGLVAFMVPYVFIYAPSILFEGELINTIIHTATALVGVYALAAAVEGFLFIRAGFILRCCLFASAILLIWPMAVVSALGFAILAAVIGGQRIRRKRLNLHQQVAAREIQ